MTSTTKSTSSRGFPEAPRPGTVRAVYEAGTCVDEQGNGVVAEPRMYQLIRQPEPIDDRQFEIGFLDAGAEAYAFTFG